LYANGGGGKDNNNNNYYYKHQHNIDSAMLPTTRRFTTEVQREKREIKGNIAEKTKERWQGKGMHSNFRIT
jgi:hypothetical protein